MNDVRRNLASALAIEVRWDGVVGTVTVSGGLDRTTAPTLTRQMLAVGAEHPETLVLDLSGLAFVDAAGARA